MAKSAWIGDLVLISHRRRDDAEGVRVNHSAGHPFALDLWHVAGDALTTGAAVFVMGVSGESWSVRAVR